MQIQFVAVNFVAEYKIQLWHVQAVGTAAVGKQFRRDFFGFLLICRYLVVTFSSNLASHFRAVFAFHVPESEKDDNEEN